MKLLRCNIVNYGCLHDFSYEFEEGVNLINRPNGWGKSTFVSFLCAMFYGLDSTNRRSIQDNERKHYFPWHGDSFGGSVEFEVSGRQYRAERFFGRREKEDTFLLYDLKTMLPSQDYTCRLGFELFGTDKNGYLKSTCILQGKTALGYNDTLAARLTGMARSEDDIERYEQAVAALDKAMRFYVKTGNRGEIALLQQSSDVASARLLKASEAKAEVNHLHSELKHLKEQELHLQEQLHCIQKQILFRTDLESQARYDLLMSQLEQKESELEHLEDFFHDQFPEETDIEFCLQSCSQLSQMQEQMQREVPDQIQLSEFTVLHNLFQSVSESNVTDTDTMDTEDTCNDSVSASGNIFTPIQQQILRNSPEYQVQASVLFLPEDSGSPSETESSSSKQLLDSSLLFRAKQSYEQYCSLLSIQKDSDQKVIFLAEELEHLRTSLNTEYQSISNCRRNLLQLQIRHQQDSQDIVHQQDSKFHQEQNADSFHKSGIFRSPGFFLLLLISASLAAGYFTTPVTGCISLLIGLLLITLIYQIYRTEDSPSSRSAGEIQSDFSAVTETEAFRSQCIQLKTEIQLRSETCSQLEEQVSCLKEKLDFAKEKASEAAEATGSCLQQLLDISTQLKLPRDNISRLISEYPDHLAALNSQLENQRMNELQSNDNRQKQLLFYKQLKRKYDDYSLRFQNQKQLEQNIIDLKKSIVDYLHPYFSVTEKDTASSLELKLHNLKSMVDSYKKLLAEMYIASQNLNIFLKEHPDFPERKKQIAAESEKLSHFSETPSALPELQNAEILIRNQYSECIQKISICQSRIQQEQELASEYPELKDKISKLNHQISEYQERYRILSLTRKYLTKARQDFADSYLRSIERNFRRYADILQKNLLQNTSINSDFHIIVSDGGILRETSWYSQGTRDLIDLCSRLAIIEDLFPDEAPFLVLDDPFVNLDEQCLHCLTDILHDIADKWQILYFTCHSSRNI
ncbi:MAG: AAA family ATPase [Blautia sp.]